MTTQESQMGLQALNLPHISPADMFSLLEARYGVGFAQWFIDQLARKRA